MMTDFDEPIRDLTGKAVKTDDAAMTIGTCAVAALQHLFPGEDATPEIKVKRFKLALRIAQAVEPIGLSADEVTTLKTVVGKFWNPLVVGRVFEAVDPESMKT
jgi:hypothetical protein